MKCGFTPVLANAGYRSLNIARGHLSPPSSRVKRLLNALPRLNTACPQEPKEPAEDSFSPFDGWQRYAEAAARPAMNIAPSPTDSARLPCLCTVVGYFDYETVLRNEMQLVYAATDRYITVTDWNLAHLAHQSAAQRAAREEREAQFYRSLQSEAFTLDRCKAAMRANEPIFVGLVPAYVEWWYRTAREAIEYARAVRRGREEWAVQFPDTRFLAMQGS